MQRYFAELAYNGTAYHGWQKQPGTVTVQQTIEEALSTLLNQPIDVLGCGRTDAGVHATQFYLHFDGPDPLPNNLLSRINKFLPKDIAIYRIFPVNASAHARFDATQRSYEYHLTFRKNPFSTTGAYYFPMRHQLNVERLQEAANTLLGFNEFFPFCKANTDVKTMRCDLRRAEWAAGSNEHELVFHISADRFLRGMVRLIVGMCLKVAQGKVSLEEVQRAMEAQTRLEGSWSAPAAGLYLTEVRYKNI